MFTYNDQISPARIYTQKLKVIINVNKINGKETIKTAIKTNDADVMMEIGSLIHLNTARLKNKLAQMVLFA